MSSLVRFRVFAGWLAALITLNAAGSPATFLPDRILIKPKPPASPAALDRFHSLQKSTVLRAFRNFGGVQVVRVPAGETVAETLARYRNSGLVEFAEPDYVIRAAAIPNDPKFLDGTLWGLNNYGQTGGTPGADIHAPEAWDIQICASNVIVAVLDTGIRYTHEDLASNMWINPNDGSHGFNAFSGGNDPFDDNGHGTLVAGVLGAAGNNGKGVTGVAWQVQLMACKCLDAVGEGSDSSLIACLEFAQTNGAKIINASLDSTAFSQSVSNAISSLRDSGIILVASTGNDYTDVDFDPRYPACYDLDNIVAVAYTDPNDLLGLYSNFGAASVDLGAPGTLMYSTSYEADDAYFPPEDSTVILKGTSFAAAYVSGSLALMKQKFPLEDYSASIFRLLHTVDPAPDLDGRCVTGGRLNVHNALCPPIQLSPLSTNCEPFRFRVDAGAYRTVKIESSTNLMDWEPVFTNTTSAMWDFDFTAAGATNSAQMFFRAVGQP